jgi:alanyl-tRNA synthetase
VNDPTLMFVNAGMVQFKDLFTGREQRAYKRACSSQKCLRISGKHNDLENVGRTARHHTFFEMLGNFSFGDYFKEDAIAYAWELLTSVLEIPKERMVVTVFGGEGGIAADDEARAIWRTVTGFGDDRIIGLGMGDNFWSMGDTGPCGPCSEIYYYHGDSPDPARLTDEPTADGSGWVEIWNLVFMQFERSIEAGAAVLRPLPAPSIDTGAGLERLAGAVGGHRSNYDTDLLSSLVHKAAAIAGKPYGASMSDDDVSMRVIADHARATAFLISEGLMPDRTGREYVLRRVMRRAIRHGHRLGIERPFLHEVALEVVSLMGGQYAELVDRTDLIATVTEQEEVRFRQTIDRGLKILDEEFARMREKNEQTLDGACAFRLYDTFGFPLDLTEVICRERGLLVDAAGYDKALEEARAKSEFKGRGRAVEQVYRDALALVPGGQARFVGYEREDADATVVAIIRDGQIVPSAAAGDAVEIVLDKTPFYGESGGQVGDRGRVGGPGGDAEIADTQKPVAGLIVHQGTVKNGEIAAGAKVRAEVDHARRDGTRRSHSATHLLHYALRRVLGEQAQQKGSLVEPDRFRFDFTSGRAVTAEEKAKIEDLVNEKILSNAPVQTEVLPIDEAKKRGAMAIFEEKYGDVVRVLTMTADSVELCGGTHARATGDIGLFKMLGETSIAAGVRRIEAVTGLQAMAHVRSLESTLAEVASQLRSSTGEVCGKVEKLVAKERELEKKVSELSKKLAMGEGGGGAGDSLASRARDVGGVKVLGVTVDIADRAALRDLAEKLRDQIGESVVLVASKADGKVSLVLTVAKGLTGRLRAGDLIRPIAQAVGGSGGGRPDMAQAGGTDVAKIDEAVESIYGAVKAAIGSGAAPQA